MGKAKKMRSASHKKNKTPSTTNGLSSVELEQYAHLPREQAEMFQGLTNAQGSIREATCVALATMFGDLRTADDERAARDKLQRMVDNGLLQKLVPLVGDPLKMVRLHALGALRNLSVTGGIDTCELMTISASVMTPLVRVITEHATLERLEKNDLHAVQVLEQAIALLANLCESCAAAVHELMRGNLLDPIMTLARHGRAHSALHVETLKLLLLITEGNATLSDVFGRNALYQVVLGELIDGDAPLYTRLHAVGIAMHVRAIMESDANVAKLLPVLEAALAYDAVHVVQAAQHAAESWTLAHATPYDDEQGELDPITEEDKAKQTQAQLHVRAWKDSVQTLTLALELVAELAAPGDDDGEEEMEDEWASDDEEAMEQYAASAQKEEASGHGASSSPVATALAASRVLPLCVAILQGVVAVPPIDHAAVAFDFGKMRARVAHALTNLVQLLPWRLLHNDALPQLFRHLCTLYRNVVAEAATQQLTFDASASDDLEAATTAAMWAVLRRCSLEKQQLPIAGDDADLLLGGALQSKSVETRLNAVGMVGCVGQQTTNASENAVVGRCLLAALRDANLEVVTETLNALFDVYSDETFDANFKQLGLLPALEAAVPAIKSKLRAEQKSMDRDLVAHVKETQLNLTRFIKYKKKHL